MRKLKGVAAAAAALTLLGSSAYAQQGRLVEMGIDAGVTFSLDEPRVTVFSFPVDNFRVGFEMTPKVALEPSLSFTSISGSGETFSAYNIALGLLWHFNEMRSGPYVRPFLGVMGGSGGGESGSQAFAGAGLGLKIPVADSRFAWRFEAFLARAFENDDFAANNQIGLRAGLSFFTR